jgi:hypothetical protein
MDRARSKHGRDENFIWCSSGEARRKETILKQTLQKYHEALLIGFIWHKTGINDEIL